MADPFASATRTWHPALKEHYKLPSDVYYPLVDGFFQDERYAKFALGFRPWQLHCFGGPGCGKTTFAAIAVEDLRKRYQGTRTRVASIFFRLQDVFQHHPSFVEDVLACVYSQLSRDADHDSRHQPQFPAQYQEAYRNGLAFVDRLEHIRTALHELLKANEHNFLVIDGYDELDPASQTLLYHELKDSHVCNLSLLLTRRRPAYHRPEMYAVTCDCCGKRNRKLYWECPLCEDEAPQFCYECQEQGEGCPVDGHRMKLAEPYSRVDLDISKPYDDNRGITSRLEQFVARQLEIGHGVLQQDCEMSESSLSTPEVKIRSELVRSITDKSWGNVNIAKLRVDDEVHRTETLSADMDKVSDRLPRSIIAFFDSEIDRIKTQSPANRDLGLMSIIAVAEYGNAEGLSVYDLERRTRYARATSPYLLNSPVRSLEDVLEAANGLLVMQPYNDEIHVICYNPAFVYYVRQDYNEFLYRMKATLGTKEGITEEAERRNWEGGQGADTEQERYWNLSDLTASPPIASENFHASKKTESIMSFTDSTYYSGQSSRNTSADSSDGLGLGIMDPKEHSPITGPILSDPMQRPSLQITSGCGDIGSQQNDPSASQICSFCEQHILQGDKTRGHHHESLEAVRQAARGHCIFCSQIYQDILPGQKYAQVTTSLRWPLYSWCVRTTGRTRNSKQSLAVTFRPISHGEHGHHLTTFTSKKYHILAETDIGSMPTEENLGKSTDPSISKGLQLKSWIKTCDETHPNCYKPRPDTFVPTRLVDLETENVDIVRVVDTALHGIKGPYGTLSHCWGRPNFLTLNPTNKEILMGPGVQISELTRNFQEAISVAKFIGLRYIWIDSLCIIQGKPSEGGDFQSEGQLMHKVYRYSFCNIAVADSADSTGGLFRNREPSDVMPVRFEADGNGKLDAGVWRILREDLWKKDLLDTKIYKRGWVFQERMLSPRILHFAASQIFWDCSTLSASESLPSGLPHPLDDIASTDRHWRGRIQVTSSSSSSRAPLVGASDNESLETFWKTALLNYTSCDLTSQSDKRVAIWSIAKMIRDVNEVPEEYGSGLWERALEEQLAWRMVRCEEGARLSELQVENPSWSWASVKGAVIAHDRVCPPRDYTVTDHDGGPIAFDVQSDDRDNEPRLKDRGIKMTGYIGNGTLGRNGDWLLKPEQDIGVECAKERGVWEVFLDETLPEHEHMSGRIEVQFVVLVASSTSPRNTTRPHYFTEHPESQSSNNDITYSGTALLLVPHQTYFSLQRDKYNSLNSLLREVVSRPPNNLTPDPPYGSGKSLVDQTKDMCSLITVLKEREKIHSQGVGLDRCYRRIGAMTFRGVPEKMWERIKGDGPVKIVLD